MVVYQNSKGRKEERGEKEAEGERSVDGGRRQLAERAAVGRGRENEQQAEGGTQRRSLREALSMVMECAIKEGGFRGIQLPNMGPLISHFCYADDVIFLWEWDEENVKNFNRILRCFSLSSGLKINLAKSSVVGVGVKEDEVLNLATILKCKSGRLPFMYLGVPIEENMKMVKPWRPVIKMIKSIRGDFVWGKNRGNCKIRWVAWKKVIAPKAMGGVDIGGLRESNLARLSKWRWKFSGEQG
ncbi:uncharacterized protein LOC110870022 [Helianthus annuus]|uniref:uncharacterized protein LOC110870022 n=1 Tax=Helianthus annuus TaxID=4232 RepID=UPI000B8F05EC|nr:uncharacterized protein LOC110870022 [Helianthus annuus]